MLALADLEDTPAIAGGEERQVQEATRSSAMGLSRSCTPTKSSTKSCENNRWRPQRDPEGSLAEERGGGRPTRASLKNQVLCTGSTLSEGSTIQHVSLDSFLTTWFCHGLLHGQNRVRLLASSSVAKVGEDEVAATKIRRWELILLTKVTRAGEAEIDKEGMGYCKYT